MSSIITKIPCKSTSIFSISRSISRNLSSSSPSAQTQKLERIADELLNLTKYERYDYAVLFRHKLGLHKFGPQVSMGGGAASSPGAAAADSKPAEKVIFDVRLEKFDASSKLKVVKAVKDATGLGLKEAKDLVDKAPSVLKKGITKDEAESIVNKLKELGATAVLE